MKTVKQFHLWSIAVLISVFFLSSCKKNLEYNYPTEQEVRSASIKYDYVFAENDMVMYWNEKAEIVLTGPFTPPAQSRYFAMIIAVHDALNSIKPKYQPFALLNERQQLASPNAAVASAAYWTIKAMNVQGAHPVDQWYSESLATIPDSYK